MRPLPIRWKFALWTVALVAVAVLVFSGGTLANIYSEQIDAVDVEVQTRADRLRPLTSLQTTYEMIDEMIRDQPLLSFALFDQDGRLLKLSKPLSEELARTALISPELRTVKGKDGAWRLGAYHQGSRNFVLAYSLSEMEETFGDILLAFCLALPIALIFAALGGWWVAGRALAPIRDLTSAAERMDSQKFDQRVVVSHAKDELARMATVFNAMLDRLKQVSRRQNVLPQTRRMSSEHRLLLCAERLNSYCVCRVYCRATKGNY